MRLPRARRGAMLVTLAILAASILLTELTRSRPGYDAFGWLVWGHQTLHLKLNTDGAPSWKPLTFLFTLPYSLLGRHLAAQLWVITAWAGALAGVVFAARIAHRLTPARPGHPAAPIVAGAIAGAGVLVIGDYAHLLLIANSDPLTATLCLAAIDSHLSGRHRLSFALLVAVGLARPEGWVFACLYAAWSWRAVPAMRPWAVCGVAAIFTLWFTVPALTSHSALHPGDLALNSPRQIHGSKLAGLIRRLRGLLGLPVQLAALSAVVWAALRRDWTWLTLAAAAGLWVAIEFAFALHGFSAVARYLLEPAAVLLVLAAAAIGRLLNALAGLPRLRVAGPVVVAAFLLGLVPYLRDDARVSHRLVSDQRANAVLVSRLDQLIDAVGGARAVRACGQPVGPVGNQSLLAWALGTNVGNIGYKPGPAIRSGRPVVVFKPHDRGWAVRAWHPLAENHARCRALRARTSFS